jgi:hypothetical protein
MKKARIIYSLSEKGRKASILAGGNGKEKQELETDITPELLELAEVTREGDVVLNLSRTRPNTAIINSDGTIEKCYMSSAGNNTFDEPQTVEQLIAWEKARIENLEKRVASLQPEAEEKKAQYEKAQAAKEERLAREKREREELRRQIVAAEQERAEKAQAEKDDWISRYGSDYLKRATALGYNCQRQYVTERLAHELSEFELDFDNRMKYNSRSCPSMEALTEVENLIAAGYSAEVVWLTHPAYEFQDCLEAEEWENCEAIVIKQYLDKYEAVKTI